jgi:hypothetical protein
MKKFFKFAAVAAITAMFVSCTEKPGPDPDKPNNPDNPDTPEVEITEDLTFTLEVTEVEIDKAKVKVEHNGTTKDTWYAFATTDTDVNKAVTAKVAELTADGGKISGLKKNTSTTITVRSLEQDTDYTFIAFGITPEGELYGTAASTTFKTEKEEVVPPTPPAPEGMTVNPNWTVAYSGAKEYEGQTYEHTATVTSTDQNAWFLSSAWPKADFDAAMQQYGIDAIAQAELQGFKKYVEQVNAYYGVNYTAADLAYVGTDWDVIEVTAGEWVVMAIGIGADSELSMLYAVSEPFTLEEEEMPEAYAAWLGDWTFTGANGITQNVTFSKGVVNQSYKMTGYEGQDLDVTVLWDPENQYWQINNQNLGTFDFGKDGEGDIWFVGKDVDINFFFAELPICMGGMFEDGSLGCIPFEGDLEMQDGSTFHYVVNDMNFFAELPAGISWISGTFQTGFPTFPIVITPAAATSSTRSVEKTYKHSSKLFSASHTFNSFASNLQSR